MKKKSNPNLDKNFSTLQITLLCQSTLKVTMRVLSQPVLIPPPHIQMFCHDPTW